MALNELHFFDAIQNDDVIGIVEAITKGADVNRFNFISFRPPLAIAVRDRKINAVHTLLKNGADPNDEYARDSFYESLRKRNSTDILRLLLKYGANPNNNWGVSMPNLCFVIDDLDKVKLLIKYGANINEPCLSENKLNALGATEEVKDLISRKRQWQARKDAVMFYEGTNGDENIGADDHISRYLLNPLVFKEIMTYHQPTGGRKKTKKARKSRRRGKRRTARQ